MTQFYAQRLVAYLDILGWSEACKVESVRLANAAKIIHDAANYYSTETRKKIEDLSKKAVNPIQCI
jgi:hypothetical protein